MAILYLFGCHPTKGRGICSSHLNSLSCNQMFNLNQQFDLPSESLGHHIPITHKTVGESIVNFVQFRAVKP